MKRYDLDCDYPPGMNERADGDYVLYGDVAIEIDALRAALAQCEHETHAMRIWGGMEWKYSPFQAGRIAKIARLALDA